MDFLFFAGYDNRAFPPEVKFPIYDGKGPGERAENI